MDDQAYPEVVSRERWLAERKARGLDHLAPGYGMLELTPYGRQEDWEDSPAGFPQRPTYG